MESHKNSFCTVLSSFIYTVSVGENQMFQGESHLRCDFLNCMPADDARMNSSESSDVSLRTGPMFN